MREILFRGKTKDGKWVEGFYCKQYNVEIPHTRDGIMHEREGDIPYCTTEVNRETVGQFTGLTDKNGKKIFEGDIVKVTICGEYDCCVCFKDYAWYFMPIDKRVKEVKFGVLKHADYEIIGNIHDNPELMEEAK